MPATPASVPPGPLTLGVDGCPCGWVAVGARPAPGCGEDADLNQDGTPRWSLSWQLVPSLDALLASRMGEDAAMIVLDVPIGLSEGPPRACDRAARGVLGSKRRASVFTAPMRPALGATSQAEATRIGRVIREGGGMSAQAWNIVPKIEEADAVMTPARQGRLREGHPEVAFARMAGAPMTAAKKTRAGAAARRDLLAARGADVTALLAAVRTAHPKRAVADDDVVDAAVLALTGQDALAGEAWHLGGGERDARGLEMEIWG